MAYGGSQARSPMGAVSHGPTPQPQQHQIRAMSVTYTIAHCDVGSLTHGARPGMELITSWFLVTFVSATPQWELLFF